MKKYRYSEIFGKTIQGEGNYTGYPTVWVRFFGCNFECAGFGQDNLDDPSTWILPYKDFDISTVNSVEELPVWKYGCDSSYSWAAKYKNLVHNDTAEDIVKKLMEVNANQFNPDGLFKHPISGQETHLAFTGGEPMLQQPAMVDILENFHLADNMPSHITIETNGSRPIKDVLADFISERLAMSDEFGGYVPDVRGKVEWFWSVSPKLRASGEKWSKAINPEVVAGYAKISNHGQLKYVVDGSDETWDEVTRATKEFRDAGVNWPVWIMPVGATMEDQENIQAKITEQAVERGYNVAARVHAWIFSNIIGK